VPLGNVGNSYAQVYYHAGFGDDVPVTNGYAQVVAGPAPDQMQPVGTATRVYNGYFGAFPASLVRNVPTVAPGQIVYYRVDVSYLVWGWGWYAHPSTTEKLVAGGGDYPVPPTTIHFPAYIEWPGPTRISGKQNITPGEAAQKWVNIYNPWNLTPTVQWRKDGQMLVGMTNQTLTITNFQAADVGVYDAFIWGFMSPKSTLSIQTLNPGGRLIPRSLGTNYICDLDGVPSRNYGILSSSNLIDWVDLLTISNATGTVSFTNPISSDRWRYYRAMLLP
jgi:hypothetical protein